MAVSRRAADAMTADLLGVWEASGYERYRWLGENLWREGDLL
jgi:hypothetical protein